MRVGVGLVTLFSAADQSAARLTNQFGHLAIALVLVRVVNPQSFHWNMDLAVPWGLLGAVTALLVFAGISTALLATRQATGAGPLRAVREDW